MPYYDYKCEKCGHVFEESLCIADRDAPTEQPCRFPTCGGEVKMMYTKAFVGDPYRFAGKKIDRGFKDRLIEIKNKNPHSTMIIPD